MITAVRYIGSGAVEPQGTDILWKHAMVSNTHHSMFLGTLKGLPNMLRVGLVLVACSFLLFAVSGCNRGPERVPVAGQVLIDGKPLTTGTIRFIPDSGRPASARIADDGSFRVITKTLSGGGAEIAGLVPGSYRMAVLASEYLSESENAEVRWLAPPRYANFRTSGLEADIKAPSEKMVVELTWEGAEESDAKAETDKPSGKDKVRETPEKKSDN